MIKMISRVTAEFETPELAELALKRARESIDYVYSAKIMYNKQSDNALKLRGGTSYTVLPSAPTAQNYVTAVMESPATEDIIPEPARRRTAHACVICGSGAVENVTALLNAMGGLNIHSAN